MSNYRIAFFTVDWNYELVESTLHGLKRFVDDHPNVHLCVFDCFGKDLDNAKDRSEYAIFDLADLSRFDGLLVQGNQIVLDRVRRELEQRISRIGIPAVTIDCPMKGCTLMAVDNRAAQRDIAAHVIERHGARRLVYLTGNTDNGCPEGQDRLDGFLDACREHGVEGGDVEVVHCTWRTSDGNAVAERWLNGGRALPDAFVCANDDMALGMIETLEKNGVRIPKDVIVTGFDDLTSAELSSPRLSTVNRDYARMNYMAMEVLLAKIEGREARKQMSVDHRLVCSESCGCRETVRPDTIRLKYFQQTRFLKNFYTLQDQMAEQLFDANGLEDLMDIVEKNHRIFGCDNVYLCINDYYFDNYDKKQWQHDSETFGQEMILAACGRNDLSADAKHMYARFPTANLLPDPLIRSERFLMFYPLHYNTYSIGYLVLNGISEASKLNLHESILSFLEIGIENVRKKCLLRQLNDVLDNLYVRDGLTQLYNRFGFERYAHTRFDAFMQSGGAQVLFVDMDDMKHINDQFGHEIGDCAIRTTADILREACRPDDFLMRYGGDEFLIIAPLDEDGLEDALQRAVGDRQADPQLPCRLKLSIGVIRVERGDTRSLDECVLAADSLMYENKKRRKERG